MTVALWLARVAVMAALTLFIGRGLALSVRARVAGVLVSLKALIGDGGSIAGGGRAGGEGTVAVVTATPDVGVAGCARFSSASLLLSSLRLALLARSRLLLPEWCTWVWALALVAVSAAAESPPGAVERNQKVMSSVFPSVSSTSLAGIPLLLQHNHAMYWLCALGREPV